MALEPKERRKEPDEPSRQDRDDASAGALVPSYGVSAIVPGTQAFRHGNVIFYTVRGEPGKVLELMGRLGREGVDEVVALIRHQAAEEPPQQPEAPPPAEPDDADD